MAMGGRHILGRRIVLLLAFLAFLACGLAASSMAAETFRVATYNLENYLLQPAGTRPGKSAEGRAKIRESIRATGADIIALQEIGGRPALEELRAALRREGCDYPHWEIVFGPDTNIQVAVLSRLPIVARRPQTNEAFLLFGRRFRVSRGFLEIDVQAGPRYSFTLITAHLKSRRPVPEADEAELREQEALVLREKIDARLRGRPNANLIVLGDLNDVQDARSTRAVIGRGRAGLVDCRPAERNGDREANPNPKFPPRQITWTHHFGKEDTFSRIDFILLSRGMAREWRQDETFIVALPNWGTGSDHRPLVATLVAEDR
jgi:endonuclease/exonuclease/phosphatase family metal-dependent hydrolase